MIELNPTMVLVSSKGVPALMTMISPTANSAWLFTWITLCPASAGALNSSGAAILVVGAGVGGVTGAAVVPGVVVTVVPGVVVTVAPGVVVGPVMHGVWVTAVPGVVVTVVPGVVVTVVWTGAGAAGLAALA